MNQLSVLMTVYNGMPHLPAAVQSVLNQSLQDFTFVVVDDGSTDATLAYLMEIAAGDPRVKILTQPNQGTAAAANRGLEVVTTPYVARMDADDISLPQRFEKQLAYLQAHPEVGIVGSQVAPLGDKSVGTSLMLPLRHDQIFETLMQGRHGLAHGSLMIRTAVLEKAGGYWSKPLIDDWDMMLRVGELASLANLNEVLMHYRVHSGSLNGTSMWRMHRHISYAIECAQRRQADLDERTFEEFESELANRPIIPKLSEWLHVYSMTHYRLAVAEIHGGRRAIGYPRLVWSALCNPPRTLHRITRRLAKPITRIPKAPQQRALS